MEKKYPIGEDVEISIEDHDLIIKGQTNGLSLEVAIYNVGYQRGKQATVRFADKSQLIREYKQYKENLNYLGGPDEWTFEKVNKLSKMEAYQAIMGFNSLISFLDNVLYAYEEGAKDWEERCLKAEAANEKSGQSQQPGRDE